MFIEKKWLRVPPRLLTTDGTSTGVITIDSVRGFYVKQHVAIKGVALPTIKLQIKRILSDNKMLVGPINGKITDYSDVSIYTMAAMSSIEAEEQARNEIPQVDRERAVYAEEPIVATRNVLVDDTGDYYNSDNPMPTSSVQINSIVPYKYDSIYPSYPDAVTEIYVYKNQGSTVATVTIVYLDSSKNEFISLNRT
jgi:hypothetical protein